MALAYTFDMVVFNVRSQAVPAMPPAAAIPNVFGDAADGDDDVDCDVDDGAGRGALDRSPQGVRTRERGARATRGAGLDGPGLGAGLERKTRFGIVEAASEREHQGEAQHGSERAGGDGGNCNMGREPPSREP